MTEWLMCKLRCMEACRRVFEGTEYSLQDLMWHAWRTCRHQ